MKSQLFNLSLHLGFLLWSASQARSQTCDALFILDQLQLSKPGIGFLASDSQKISPSDRGLVLDFLKEKNPSNEAKFVSEFNAIQVQFPRLSVYSTLDLMRILEAKNISLEQAAKEVKGLEQLILNEIQEHKTPQILGRPNFDATPFKIRELAFFFFETLQKSEALSTNVLKDFVSAALEMGTNDVSMMAPGLKLALSSGVGISQIQAVHDSLTVTTPAMGFGATTKTLSPKFFDSTLMAVYQKARSMNLSELEDAAKAIMKRNPAIRDPHGVALEMMSQLEKDKDKLSVEVLDLLRKLRRKKETDEGYSI